MAALREFHVNVFGTVLRLEKLSESMIFDCDKAPAQVLVAPITGSRQ